jgi:hypothetical protein
LVKSLKPKFPLAECAWWLPFKPQLFLTFYSHGRTNPVAVLFYRPRDNIAFRGFFCMVKTLPGHGYIRGRFYFKEQNLQGGAL